MKTVIQIALLFFARCAATFGEPSSIDPIATNKVSQTAREYYAIRPKPVSVIPVRIPWSTYLRWKEAGDTENEKRQGTNLYFTVLLRSEDQIASYVNVRGCVTTNPKPDITGEPTTDASPTADK